MNRTPTYQIVPSHIVPIDTSPLRSLCTLSIPAYTSPVSQHPQGNDQEPDVPFIPGGGLTRRFLCSLPANWSVPTAALLQFVLEGDNRDGGYFLASSFSHILSRRLPFRCSDSQSRQYRMSAVVRTKELEDRTLWRTLRPVVVWLA